MPLGRREFDPRTGLAPHCNFPAFGHNLRNRVKAGRGAAVVHGFKHYEVRLRQSQRRPYVIARRLFKGTAIMALAIVLFAIYRAGQI
jgi:hypothetical protein